MAFRIYRGDDELEIKFTLKYDRYEQDYYPDRTYIADSEEEIDLTDEENRALMDYFECNKEKLLYHNDKSIL